MSHCETTEMRFACSDSSLDMVDISCIHLHMAEDQGRCFSNIQYAIFEYFVT